MRHSAGQQRGRGGVRATGNAGDRLSQRTIRRQPTSLAEAFRQALAKLGYVVGRNVAIEYRYADNSMDRLREHAAELVSRKVAVIAATGGNNSALVAKALTSTIPILFTSGLDAFGVRLLVLKPSTPDEINAAFETLARERVDAAIVGSSPYYTSIAKDVIALAERHRIPAAYSNREWGEAGGLVAYGNSIADAYRRVGNYAARILKGAKPADLPVDRAVKFELIINLKAAKAFGLTLPHSLLSRADEVID